MKSKSQVRRENALKGQLHCVQCQEKIFPLKDSPYPICDNPQCPNYGLLQAGIEGMPTRRNNDARTNKHS